MTDSMYFYDPKGPHGLAHDPFKAIIAPRVIAWISSRSAAGQLNLAPYSFCGAFSNQPKLIGFSSDGCKDTLRNIEETGEFTWNMVSRDMLDAMNTSSAAVAHGVDEFTLSGLQHAPGRSIETPYVADTPVALECRLVQIIHLHDLDGQPTANRLVLGQVVGVLIQPRCLRDGRFDLQAAQPVMRAGYRGDYAALGEMFELLRPA